MNNLNELKEDIRRIRHNATDPNWVTSKMRERTAARLSQFIYGTGGIDISAEDWDNLIILDGCRTDLFESVFDTERFDDYDTVQSRGSLTAEWVRANFSNKEFGDTIYVSGNPFVSMHAGESFHQLVEPWIDDFNEEAGTVLPEMMVRKALESFDKNKRLVVHFMQPHWPFYSTEIGRSPDNSMDIIGRGVSLEKLDYHNPFQALRQGEYKVQDVWDAYRQTLISAHDPVLDLVDRLEGKTVITSDHGNLFGEKVHRYLPISLFGHPTRGLRIPELVEVPWVTINGTRRDIQDGAIASSISSDDKKIVNDRLADLGYIN